MPFGGKKVKKMTKFYNKLLIINTLNFGSGQNILLQDSSIKILKLVKKCPFLR